MLRLSRIHSPRATIAAIALLAVVALSFGALADAHQSIHAPALAEHATAAGSWTVGDVLIGVVGGR